MQHVKKNNATLVTYLIELGVVFSEIKFLKSLNDF